MSNVTLTARTRGILPDQIGFNLRIAYSQVMNIFSEVFADLDVTPLQFAMLEVIAKNELITQSELIEMIGTHPTVAVKPLRDLEKAGIIVRTRDEEDRRKYMIQLSDKGKILHSQTVTAVQKVEARLSSELTVDEQEILRVLLKKINRFPND